MCGISVLVSSDMGSDDPRIDRMTDRLAHRGPDAKGHLRLPGCHLGHTRLSIIDLGTGAQPMTDFTGRYAITFNGEIYNYQELRPELEAHGYRFHTQSDTEVILAAYAKWGAHCLDRFRGMFAFVIWDTQEQELFAGRDLLGEKPLYYATLPDGSFVAASEIKALLASGSCQPRLSLEAIDAYLTLAYIPPNQTVYANVETLPPGHYLTWRAGSVRVQRYWIPQLDPHDMAASEAAERLSALLAQAVRRQMVADVPVGAFLSGGVDSSTIVALMQSQTPRPVQTFSVGFGNLINELPYARMVAEKYQTEHHEVDLGEPPVGEMLPKMAEVYDEPFADSSAIPTYLISEFARRYVKVVLSGDGGDELFGGYSWYPTLWMSERAPSSRLLWLATRALSYLAFHRIRPLSTYSDVLGLTARIPGMLERTLCVQTHFLSRERQVLWAGQRREVPEFSVPRLSVPPNGTTGLETSFFLDHTCYLPGDILVKVDRAAMAHGLETRAPYLDRDVVEFMLTVPSSLKVHGEQRKILFRRAFESKWPPEVRDRSKQGFGAPFQRWLALPEVHPLLEEALGRRSPLHDLLPGVRTYDHSRRTYQTWILLMLGLWLRKHPTAA